MYIDMDVTTNFANWLSAYYYDFEEIYSLYQSVDKVERWSFFEVTQKETKNGTEYFVKSDICDVLLRLASEKARKAFLTYIEIQYCGELNIESWYGDNYFNRKYD